MFDHLGRSGSHHHQGREHSVDSPTKEEKDNQSRLDRLLGQQYGLEQVEAAGPPFTPTIMVAPYPSRFKMLSVASYDGSMDTEEHLENYQAHMLI